MEDFAGRDVALVLRRSLAVAEDTKSLRRVWAFPADGGEPRRRASTLEQQVLEPISTLEIGDWDQGFTIWDQG